MPEPLSLTFAPLAAADLQEISRYTTVQWGDEQTRVYLESFHHELERLIEFPRSGRVIERIEPETRLLVHGSHCAIYRTVQAEIIVLRIVHSRRITDRLLGSL